MAGNFNFDYSFNWINHTIKVSTTNLGVNYSTAYLPYYADSLKSSNFTVYKHNYITAYSTYDVKSITDAEKGTAKYYDMLCWAATASNMLSMSRWSLQSNEDKTFSIFSTVFTGIKYGGYINEAAEWYLTGKLTSSLKSVRTKKAVPAGSIYKLSSAKDYVSTSADLIEWDNTRWGKTPQKTGAAAMSIINEAMTKLSAGYSVGLSIYLDNNKGGFTAGHAITVTGFAKDQLGNLTGIFVSDSDDDRVYQNPVLAPNNINFMPIANMNSDGSGVYVVSYYGRTYDIGGFTYVKPYIPSGASGSTGWVETTTPSTDEDPVPVNDIYFVKNSRWNNEVYLIANSGGTTIAKNVLTTNDSIVLSVRVGNEGYSAASFKLKADWDLTSQTKTVTNLAAGKLLDVQFTAGNLARGIHSFTVTVTDNTNEDDESDNSIITRSFFIDDVTDFVEYKTGTVTSFTAGKNQRILKGATAQSIVIPENYGQYVMAGGIAIGSTVSAGSVQIVRGGTADSTTVLEDGVLYADTKAKVTSATVEDGGYLYIYDSGSTADGGTVEAGGTMLVGCGALAKNVTVQGGITVYNGGSAQNITVSGGGAMSLVYDGYAKDTKLEVSGTQTVNDSLAVGNTFTGAGTSQTVENYGEARINTFSGGAAQTVTSAIAINNTFTGGSQTVTNGYIENTTLGGGATQILNNETYSYNTTIGNLCSATVDGTSYAENYTVGNGGVLTVMGVVKDGEGNIVQEGGVVAGETFVDTTGKIVFEDGAQIADMITLKGTLEVAGAVSNCLTDYSDAMPEVRMVISGRDPLTGGFFIDNISAFAPLLSVLADEKQQNGTYKLADNAHDFNGYLSVSTSKTEYFATLTVNGPAAYYNGKNYSATIISDGLMLNVEDYSLLPTLSVSTTNPTNQNVTVKAIFDPLSVKNEFALAGQKWQTYRSGGISVSANSTLYVRSTDKWGNVFTSSVDISNIDKVKPVLAKITPVVDAYSVTLNLGTTIQDNIDYYLVNGIKVDGTLTSYELTGLSVGKKKATVQVFDTAGNYSAVASVSYTIKDVTAPTEVTTFKDVTTTNKYTATLSWDPATDNVGVSYYKVYLSGNGTDKVFKTSVSTFKVTGLAAGNYDYYVSAVDAAGNMGDFSSVQSFEMQDYTAPVLNRSGLTAQKTMDGDLNISWGRATDNVAVTEYQLRYGTTSTLGDVKIMSADELSTQLTNLQTGKLYYQLVAFDGAGNFAQSKIYTANIA